MTIDRYHDYQKLALRTAPQDTPQRHLIHAALGMAGELGEILTSTDDDNLVEELGDYLWYFCLFMFATNADIEDYEFESLFIEDLEVDFVNYTATIVDQVKRHVYYHTDFNRVKLEEALRHVLKCVSMYASECSVSINKIMELNIKKLMVRYPDQYCSRRAVERDTKKESKVFDVLTD